MRKRAKVQTLAAALMATIFVVTAARATTFDIDETVGAGSVSGTISTDGTIGTLVGSDITGWTLTISNGTSSFVLEGPTSGNNSVVDLVGSALSETANTLSFDFSAGDGSFVLFQNPYIGSGKNYFCAEAANSLCTGFTQAGLLVAITNDGDQQLRQLSGEGTIRAVNVASAPEPATLGLMCLGLLSIHATRRRRRNEGAFRSRSSHRGDRTCSANIRRP